MKALKLNNVNINNHNEHLDRLYDDKCYELNKAEKQFRIANNKLDFERFGMQVQLDEKQVELAMAAEVIEQWKMHAAQHVAKTNQDLTALNQLKI